MNMFNQSSDSEKLYARANLIAVIIFSNHRELVYDLRIPSLQQSNEL